MPDFNRVAVIGLDCADPVLFKQWREKLPTIDKLMNQGLFSPMKSTIPPITVPAWMAMATSKSPGDLGIYGFRNRVDYSYGNLRIAQGDQIYEKTVWDILGLHGKTSIILGVPLTYPVRYVKGQLVSCFLTPGTHAVFTSPSRLKEEVLSKFPLYKFDVENFRSKDYRRLEQEIKQFTEQQFDLAEYLIENKSWDFFMMVNMGTDRIQHAFWHFMDEEHVLHEPNSEYKETILNHYRLLDERIERLLKLLPDDTLIMIVSDHGAQRMEGGFCINEWLIDNGYLHLKNVVKQVTPFTKLDVDWSKTKAFANGGYYGRLFLNIKGREPEGTVEPDEVELLLSEIKAKLSALKLPDGSAMNNTLYIPHEIYPTGCKNIPPDGILYFHDLYWRSIGSVGHGSWFIKHNDSGPDGANHSQYGVFLCVQKRNGIFHYPEDFQFNPEREELLLYDVAPTILDGFGIMVPADMQGVSLFRKKE